MKKELKPCPFCGEIPEKPSHFTAYWVECLYCGATGPSKTSTATAIKYWNKRPFEQEAKP